VLFSVHTEGLFSVPIPNPNLIPNQRAKNMTGETEMTDITGRLEFHGRPLFSLVQSRVHVSLDQSDRECREILSATFRFIRNSQRQL